MNAFIWINFKVLPFIIRNSPKQFGPLFFLVQQNIHWNAVVQHKNAKRCYETIRILWMITTPS